MSEKKEEKEEKKGIRIPASVTTNRAVQMIIMAFFVGMLVGCFIQIVVVRTIAKKDFAKPAQTEPAKTTPQNAPETAKPTAVKEPEVTYKVEEKTNGDEFFIAYKKYTDRGFDTLATFTCDYSYNGKIEGSRLIYYSQSNNRNRVVIWLNENNKIESVDINWSGEYVCNRECNKNQEKAYCDEAKKVCNKAQEKVDYWLLILDWPTRCANYKPPTPLEQME